MPIPISFRAQQTSNTSGTGTLTLIAAAGNRRAIATATGSVSTCVSYVVSLPGTNEWEVGIGVHNGANPGTLTRVAVTSNYLGTTSLVAFSAGTKDVFLTLMPGQRGTVGFTGATTASLADVGAILNFTGSASVTLSLPGAATVPIGSGYMVRNAGSEGAVLTIDPSGAETIGGATTLLVFTGETCEIFATATGWLSTGVASTALVKTNAVTAVGNVDFVLPSSAVAYQIKFFCTLSSAGQLLLRTSTNGGSTFSAGASDYNRAYIHTLGASGSNISADVGSSILLSGSSPSVSPVHGTAEIFPGDGAQGAQVYQCQSKFVDTGGAVIGTGSFAGNRVAAGAVNAIRLLPSSGNFAAAGYISLFAIRT